ncbi:response regulator transcription factor [Glutamicibacter arilaitensis]|nr:LuxR C-terminal-related transcriptional regulator [Glutamicibacter arilaitensis]
MNHADGQLALADQLTQLLASASTQDIALFGAAGMGKGRALREALRQTQLPDASLRLVCSRATQQIPFGVLEPYLEGPEGPGFSVAEAVAQLAGTLAGGVVLPWVLVEEGHFLDPASAYVLSLLSGMNAARILVLSTDLDLDSEINQLLLANDPIQLVATPLDTGQLRARLEELVGTQVSAATVLAFERLTGGVPEIVEAVYAQLAPHEPPGSGVWSVPHPIQLSGHRYFEQMQELVSRLDAATLGVYRQLAAVPDYSGVAAPDSGLGLAELQLLPAGYASVDAGRVVLQAQALAWHLAADPQYAPGETQHAELEALDGQGVQEQASALLAAGNLDAFARLAGKLKDSACGREVLAAADEICGNVAGLQGYLDGLKEFAADARQPEALSTAEGIRGINAEVLRSFARLDLLAAARAASAWSAADAARPRNWHPRVPVLFAGTLALLHTRGPEEAAEFAASLYRHAPAYWVERQGSLALLCQAMAQNAAGNFLDTRTLAGHAMADLRRDDAWGLGPSAAALLQSLSSERLQGIRAGTSTDLDLLPELVFSGKVPNLAMPLWFHLAALAVANQSDAEVQPQDYLWCSQELLQTSDWSWVLGSIIRLVSGQAPVGTRPAAAYASERESGPPIARRRQDAVLGADLEYLFRQGHRLAAYLMARGLRDRTSHDTTPSAEQVDELLLTEILARVRQDLEAAGREPLAGQNELRELLTEREYEIAQLAHTGLNNREIAAALFLSRRTVEGHLYRAFQKLNVTTRAELATVSFA